MLKQMALQNLGFHSGWRMDYYLWNEPLSQNQDELADKVLISKALNLKKHNVPLQ